MTINKQVIIISDLFFDKYNKKENIMGYYTYNVTTAVVNTDEPGSNVYYHEGEPRTPYNLDSVPGWCHRNPISTQIDLQSVADALSDYKYTKGLVVTVDDLLHPKPMDYEPTPANRYISIDK